MNEEKELITLEDDGSAKELGSMIQEILSPVLEAMATFMRQSTEALQNLAAQQKIQSDHIEALEKQIRLNTPVTPVQVRYINDEIRKRGRELLNQYALSDDKKAVTKLAAKIRKSIITRYGIAAMSEIPRHEYSVVLTQINIWSDALAVLDTVKEARKNAQQDG